MNSYQVYDDISLTRGNHSLNFGFACERIHDNDPIERIGNDRRALSSTLINGPVWGTELCLCLGELSEEYASEYTWGCLPYSSFQYLSG